MGDGLKITKDKRHRSSSSLAGGTVEGTRSERRLDIRASIPEVDDQFVLAQARCDDLQEKIDNVKESQGALRRFELPNPTRGYLDPATIEQHQMVGQVRGYSQLFRQPQVKSNAARKSPKPHSITHGHPEGDAYEVDSSTGRAEPQEVACGDDEVITDTIIPNDTRQYYDNYTGNVNVKKKKAKERDQKKLFGARRRNKDSLSKENVPNQHYGMYDMMADYTRGTNNRSPNPGRRHTVPQSTGLHQGEERPVVELFNKSRDSTSPDSWQRQPYQRIAPNNMDCEQKIEANEVESIEQEERDDPKKERSENRKLQRRLKFRGRHYELPTVASQMKQTGQRYGYEKGPMSCIPFIGSKSTAPSHNIGVNVQQVLNGIKVQQPLSRIPLTMAHHMGLDNVSSRSKITPQNKLVLNTIRLGNRVVRLPSYKRLLMSYTRVLHMYREGDGLVSRFLRSTVRCNYTYPTMAGVPTNRDDATSKAHSESQDAKSALELYAQLYHDYENILRQLKEEPDNSELEYRKKMMEKELNSHAKHIGKVIGERKKYLVDHLNELAENEEDLQASTSAYPAPRQ
ncbi:unnamed protein product [Leptosia nina]|uniref:Uncharacterized protein n=1 Tax=Leptosia nina TaxID=320188 RepID=A0AAV1K0T2_9NEOP